MDWITRNEGQFWLFVPLALGAVGLFGRLSARPIAIRLQPVAAILGGVLILAAAIAGGELAIARAWVLAPVAAILVLEGLAALGASSHRHGEAGDVLVPSALAVLAVTADSIVSMIGAVAALSAWAGLSGLRAAQRSIGLARVIALSSVVISLGLALQGARLRGAGGASGAIEWLGLPLRGDAGTTAIFVALVIPLLLPGRAGGPTAGLCARAGASRRSSSAVLIHLTLIWALQSLFGEWRPCGPWAWPVSGSRWSPLAGRVARLASGMPACSREPRRSSSSAPGPETKEPPAGSRWPSPPTRSPRP